MCFVLRSLSRCLPCVLDTTFHPFPLFLVPATTTETEICNHFSDVSAPNIFIWWVSWRIVTWRQLLMMSQLGAHLVFMLFFSFGFLRIWWSLFTVTYVSFSSFRFSWQLFCSLLTAFCGRCSWRRTDWVLCVTSMCIIKYFTPKPVHLRIWI